MNDVVSLVVVPGLVSIGTSIIGAAIWEMWLRPMFPWWRDVSPAGPPAAPMRAATKWGISAETPGRRDRVLVLLLQFVAVTFGLVFPPLIVSVRLGQPPLLSDARGFGSMLPNVPLNGLGAAVAGLVAVAVAYLTLAVTSPLIRVMLGWVEAPSEGWRLRAQMVSECRAVLAVAALCAWGSMYAFTTLSPAWAARIVIILLVFGVGWAFTRVQSR